MSAPIANPNVQEPDAKERELSDHPTEPPAMPHEKVHSPPTDDQKAYASEQDAEPSAVTAFQWPNPPHTSQNVGNVGEKRGNWWAAQSLVAVLLMSVAAFWLSPIHSAGLGESLFSSARLAVAGLPKLQITPASFGNLLSFDFPPPAVNGAPSVAPEVPVPHKPTPEKQHAAAESNAEVESNATADHAQEQPVALAEHPSAAQAAAVSVESALGSNTNSRSGKEKPTSGKEEPKWEPKWEPVVPDWMVVEPPEPIVVALVSSSTDGWWHFSLDMTTIDPGAARALENSTLVEITLTICGNVRILWQLSAASSTPSFTHLGRVLKTKVFHAKVPPKSAPQPKALFAIANSRYVLDTICDSPTVVSVDALFNVGDTIVRAHVDINLSDLPFFA